MPAHIRKDWSLAQPRSVNWAGESSSRRAARSSESARPRRGRGTWSVLASTLAVPTGKTPSATGLPASSPAMAPRVPSPPAINVVAALQPHCQPIVGQVIRQPLHLPAVAGAPSAAVVEDGYGRHWSIIDERAEGNSEWK